MSKQRSNSFSFKCTLANEPFSLAGQKRVEHSGSSHVWLRKSAFCAFKFPAAGQMFHSVFDDTLLRSLPSDQRTVTRASCASPSELYPGVRPYGPIQFAGVISIVQEQWCLTPSKPSWPGSNNGNAKLQLWLVWIIKPQGTMSERNGQKAGGELTGLTHNLLFMLVTCFGLTEDKVSNKWHDGRMCENVCRWQPPKEEI